MPNRQTHAIAGTITSLVVARRWAQVLEPMDRIPFLTGVGLGGCIGGVLPDVLEPATNPGHRQAAHSIAAALGLVLLSRNQIPAVLRRLLQDAHMARDPAARWWCFFTAGFVAGLAPGYLVHLGLDFGTPARLPLLGSLS